MTAVWNLDHAIGGGMVAAVVVLAVVGLPILFMLSLARAAGRSRPTPPRHRERTIR
jgi:sugar phosphate permease